MNRPFSLSAIVALGILGAGCAESSDEAVGQSRDDLRHGVVSSDLAAIGKVVTAAGFCTGTLIAPRAVLTSAHCFDHDKNDDIGVLTNASFEITPEGGGPSHAFAVDNHYAHDAKVFGGGATDVALLHLVSAVPASLAEPIAIAARAPQKPERVYQFGYGCQSRNAPYDPQKNPLMGEKQMVSFLWGSDHEENCEGDSGGPSIELDVVENVTTPHVFRVTKGHQAGLLGGDRYASVLGLKADLEGVIAAWARGEAAGRANQP